MSSRRVEFHTVDGTILRGDYFTVAGENNPLVIMTQGLTLLKEHYLPQWAAHFQAAGIAALIYDHRGWGSSEGSASPVDPMQQAEDYHDAVLFGQHLNGIDPSGIAIWGIGHSGGASMIEAGDDPNIKAVVLVMPFISGALDASMYLQGAYLDESDEQANADRYGILLHGPVPRKFILGAKKLSDAAGTPWDNRISLESLYRISKVEPGGHIYRIAPKPLLYLAASEDPPSGPFDMQQKVYERALGPNKTFVRLEGEHIRHDFDETFERPIKEQTEWLKQNL